MPKYDLHAGRGDGSYLLDVQSDLIEGLTTRVVLPVLPAGRAPRPARILNPRLEINGDDYVVATQFLAAVPLSELGNVVSNLSHRADEFTRAMDLLFQGF